MPNMEFELMILRSRPELRSRVECSRGACVAQLVKHLIYAWVMISRFMSSSPVSGSVLSAQSLQPVSGSEIGRASCRERVYVLV